MGLCRRHPFQGVPAGWYTQVNGGQSPHRSSQLPGIQTVLSDFQFFKKATKVEFLYVKCGNFLKPCTDL